MISSRQARADQARDQVPGPHYASTGDDFPPVCNPPWTPARVRAELPAVRVLLTDGTILPGRVCGRALPFARVSIDGDGRNGEARVVDAEWSWQSVAAALNAGRPVRL